VGRIAAQPLDQADVDDAAAVCAQMRQGGADHEKGRGQVDRQNALPIGEAHLLQPRLLHQAGTVDQNVEPPGTGNHLADHLSRAVLPHAPGNGLPDSAAPAGDQSDLVPEAPHVTGFPPLTSTREPHM
jgi:hypothetical protein